MGKSLADRSHEPADGARLLKRVIRKFVRNPLAEAILSGRVKDGEVVSLTASDGELALIDAAQRKAA